MSHKTLPSGLWISFRCISVETTDVDLQAYLEAAGITVPLEHISVGGIGKGHKLRGAIIVFPEEEVAKLIDRAIEGLGKNLNGRIPRPYVPNRIC